MSTCITQHQDCTSTVIKTTEAAGKFTVGYHADASKLAPKGWVTGSEWAWGDLYTDIVKTALAGEFTGSQYNANYRVGYKTGDNPFVQSKFGKMVTAKEKAEIAAAKDDDLDRRARRSPARSRTRAARSLFAAGVDPDLRGDRGDRRLRQGRRRRHPEELTTRSASVRVGPPPGGPTRRTPIGSSA